MTGIIALSRQIYCKNEVLGKEFSTNISGIELKIYFPALKSKEMRKALEKGNTVPLVPPTFARPILLNDKPINWGYLSNTSRKDASILYLACSVECSPEDEERIANVLLDASVKWEENFVNYCNLAGRYISKLSKNQKVVNIPFTLFGRRGVIGRGATYYVDMKYAEDSQFLSTEQIAKAIEFASSSKEFNMEYQLLLVASESKRNFRNKHAIFDACSAVEVCLNKVIDNYANNIGKKPEELPKHRLLGDKFKLVKQIDPNFPNIDAEKIVDLRNDIAHSRKSVFTDNEAEEVIHSVEICLEHFTPELF